MLVCKGCHRLSGLNNRNSFLHSSGGWKSKIKGLAGLVSPEPSLVDLQTITFLLHPPTVFPLCVRIPGVCVVSLSYKDTTQIGVGQTLMASF